MKKKAMRRDVADRIVKLSNYLNGYDNGLCTDQDWKLIEAIGYNNRKTLQRDLKRLEDMNYIQIDTTIQTPATVTGGTAKQRITKSRVISFLSSDDGLRPLPRMLQAGDVIGRGVFNGTEITYKKEDRKTSSQWIVGWDHSLIRNPNYKG